MRSFLYTSLFLAAFGCGTTTPIDGTDQLDTPIGKADAASVPSGAYVDPGADYGELATLTLNADHTFARSEIVACAGGGTCDPVADTGTFLFTHSSTKRYLRFYAADGTALDRYAWKLSPSGALQLERDGGDHWFTMTEGAPVPPVEPAACQLDSDCSGFLPQFCRVCSDGTTACAHWSCLDSACLVTSCK
jgi:hypothetical protein